MDVKQQSAVQLQCLQLKTNQKKSYFLFSCANKTFLCRPLDIFFPRFTTIAETRIKQGTRSKTKSLFSQTIKERLTLEGSR